MDLRRIALAFLLFSTFSVHGKPTKTPAVTFRGSGRTTPGPNSAGANNIMYRVVLPICVFLLVAAVIAIFCCHRYMAWRRREKKQATDLQMIHVEKPVVQKPVVKIKKDNIRPAKDKIKKERPIIEQLKAAKKEEEKIIKTTSKTEEENITNITCKTEKEIMKRPSRLKRFRKWIKKRTQKNNTCCSCRSMD